MTEPGPAGAGTPGAGAPPAAGTEGNAGGNPPPSTVTAPWDGSQDVYKVGEGDKAVPWYDTIKEEPVRDLMRTKAYKNPAEVAMAYHNANKLLNEKGDVVAIPKADAPKEAWDKFYTAMGRPEAADKYEFKAAEGVVHDANMVKFGQELFYELGIPAAKAGAAVAKWDAFVQSQQKAISDAQNVKNTEELKALDIKFGADLEVNKVAGLAAMNAFKNKGVSEELIQRVEKNIGAASVVELLAALGRAGIGKGEPLGGQGGGGTNTDPNDPSTMSKEQVSARIANLQGDAAFQAKYVDKNHPEHKDAVNVMVRLFAAQG